MEREVASLRLRHFDFAENSIRSLAYDSAGCCEVACPEVQELGKTLFQGSQSEKLMACYRPNLQHISSHLSLHAEHFDEVICAVP